MSSHTTRPLSDRTWLRPDHAREYTPFDSTWSKTLTLLEREVAALAGKDLVIGVDITENALRLDGGIRANARSASPAVEVAFDSRHGPMLYRCDRYVSRWSREGPGWQQNVRAIAKTLEALRAVDRYGASSSGEQYAGYRQIAATPAVPTRDALARLRAIAGYEVTDTDMPLDVVIRRAYRHAHPDRPGGSPALWAEVEELVRAIGGDR